MDWERPIWRCPKEEKWKDFYLVDAARGLASAGELISNGTTNNFCLVPQGDGPNDREGACIYITSMEVTYKVNILTTAAVDTGQNFRVIFAIDHQCNRADPPLIATDTGMMTNTPAAETDTMAYINPVNGDRFEILYDHIHNLDKQWGAYTGAGNIFGGGGITKRWSYDFEEPLKIDYDQSATTGATSTMSRNNLFGVTFADTDNAFNFVCVTRIWYEG